MLLLQNFAQGNDVFSFRGGEADLLDIVQQAGVAPLEYGVEVEAVLIMGPHAAIDNAVVSLCRQHH